jgi:hypothetical protein
MVTKDKNFIFTLTDAPGREKSHLIQLGGIPDGVPRRGERIPAALRGAALMGGF